MASKCSCEGVGVVVAASLLLLKNSTRSSSNSFDNMPPAAPPSVMPTTFPFEIALPPAIAILAPSPPLSAVRKDDREAVREKSTLVDNRESRRPANNSVINKNGKYRKLRENYLFFLNPSNLNTFRYL